MQQIPKRQLGSLGAQTSAQGLGCMVSKSHSKMLKGRALPPKICFGDIVVEYDS